MRRSPNALLMLALLAEGCGGVRSTFHDVDVPLLAISGAHPTGETAYALHAGGRTPGAMELRVERFQPCLIELNSTVDRTHVTVRTAPPFTGALWFAGATLSGLGAAIVGIATARGGPREAGDLAAGISIGAAGAAALAVAAGYGLAARDRREHVGKILLTTETTGLCEKEPAAGVAVALLDASGATIASGKSDDHGRWTVTDAAGETAVAARVDGHAADTHDAFAGWRCRADERALFDDFMRDANRALAADLAFESATLTTGSTDAPLFAGTRAHVFAVTATGAAAVLDAPGATETSLYTIRLNALAAPRGLTVTGRAYEPALRVGHAVRAHAPGCVLLLEYTPAAPAAAPIGPLAATK